MILKSSTDPDVTESISIFWSCISFVSIKKSLLANSSATLYGKVFLIKLFDTKSKFVCELLSKFSLTILDLNVLPMKYGNCGWFKSFTVAW